MTFPPPPGTLLGPITDAMAPPSPTAPEPVEPARVEAAGPSAKDRELAALRSLAETEPDRAIAVSAFLLGHCEVREPGSMRWTCACEHEPRVGEMHAKHVAGALLRLLHRRGWLVTPR